MSRSYPPGKSSPVEARKIVLGLFKRWPGRAMLIGPISMELGCYYSLNDTFWLLEEMVGDGVLRHARRDEKEFSCQVAYVEL